MILALCFIALRRPWVGIIAWVWVSLMNPHRYCYGFAFDMPWAQIIALSFFVGLLFSKDRHKMFASGPVTLIAIFCVWMTLSWLFGLDWEYDYDQWIKVMKIFLMVLLSFVVIRSKVQIIALVWTCALSLGLLGAKGGVFTILKGGVHRVWGPPGSFIEDNNEFALALVMTIPLLRFLQLQLVSAWARHVMTALMVLCAAAAVGSQSRGGLLALIAMALLMWWRGGSRFGVGVVIVVVAALLVGFMPAEWTDRMNSIGGDYAEDRSSLNRISAWWTAWGVAKDYVFGSGFHTNRLELFQKYSPYAESGTWAAHSIYFQMMGNHGFIGLGLFLSIFISAWYVASRVRRMGLKNAESLWCAQLAAMCQVSLLGYAAGGAFLSLAYFDLPYYVVTIVVVVDLWTRRQSWKTEAAPVKGRWLLPGVMGPARS